MPKKLTQDQVEREFTDKGCQLLEEYKGNQQSMKYRCKCGEIAQTSLVGFRKSDGCYRCSDASAGRKFTYEEVKQYFEDQGCELLDSEYPNNGVLLNYRCSCGLVSKVRFRDFKNGRRCQNCKKKKISQTLALDEDKVRAKVEAYGVKFVKSWLEWSNDRNRTRITYICECGRETDAWLSNFYKVQNCKECGKAKKSGSNCYMYDPDREAVAMRKRFRKMCGQHIRRFMRATGQTKTKSTHKLLGYKPLDLQEHILNHPDFAKCKDGEWHVDHIFPIQAFLDHGIHDLILINDLSNLRPMPGPENLSKADKYDEKEFEKWLREKV
jgi:hypothetical protein